MNMTDRDLLELAAKAAGIGPLDFDYAEREGHGLFFGPRLPLPQGVLMAATYTYWNPLTDDGDALRLAIDLQISFWSDGLDVHVNAEKYTAQTADELYVTARRAIVRAAAEIGKTL